MINLPERVWLEEINREHDNDFPYHCLARRGSIYHEDGSGDALYEQVQNFTHEYIRADIAMAWKPYRGAVEDERAFYDVIDERGRRYADIAHHKNVWECWRVTHYMKIVLPKEEETTND